MRHLPEVGSNPQTAPPTVDLVLGSPGRLAPIQVKWTTGLPWADAAHPRTLLDEYPDRAPAGVIGSWWFRCTTCLCRPGTGGKGAGGSQCAGLGDLSDSSIG